MSGDEMMLLGSSFILGLIFILVGQNFCVGIGYEFKRIL